MEKSVFEIIKKKPPRKLHNPLLARFLIPLYFILASVIIEFITFGLLNFDLAKLNFIIDFFLICFLAGFIFLFGKRVAQGIIAGTFLTIHSLLLFINYTLSLLYGDVFSFDMLFLAGDAFAAFERSIINWGVVFLSIGLIVLNIGMIIFLAKRIPKTRMLIMPELKKKHFLNKVLIFGMIFVITLGGFHISASTLNEPGTMAYSDEIDIQIPVMQNNDKMLFEEYKFKFEALNTFGTYGYLWRNLVRTVQGWFESSNVDDDVALEFLRWNNQNMSASSDMSFSKANPQRLDNNVVVIMAESLEKFAIYQDLTPNLWALENGLGIAKTDGSPIEQADGSLVTLGNYSATNYLSKSKTNFSEMGGLTGSAPYYSTMANSWDGVAAPQKGDLAFALPSKFADKGYTTNYLLNHDKTFYNRVSAYGENGFGFQNLYDAASIPGLDAFKGWGDWVPDSDVIDYYINAENNKDGVDILPAGEKFFTWITTMSTHGPYRPDNNSLLQVCLEQHYDVMEFYQWENPFENTADEDHFKHYVATVMELDKMIGAIIDSLAAKNILDTTTIMLYADHEAYYDNLAEKAKDIPALSSGNPNVYRIPMYVMDASFIPTEQEYEIEKFTTFFDVYATIMDLFNMQFNQNFSFGTSLFNKTIDPYRVYISPTGGILNQYMYTRNGGTDFLSYMPSGTTLNKEEYCNAINRIIFKANINKAVFENRLYKELAA